MKYGSLLWAMVCLVTIKNSYSSTVWLVNLSDHNACFTYYHTLIPHASIRPPQGKICAPALSVSRGNYHGAQYLGLIRETGTDNPAWLQTKDLTLIYTKGQQLAAIDRTTPTLSYKLKEIIAKHFGEKSIQNILKNWPRERTAQLPLFLYLQKKFNGA